jgi:hypothetical protein
MDGTWIRHPLGALWAHLSLALALLAPAAAAHAQSPAKRWPVGGPAMQAAHRVAIEHWGREPCHGDIEVSWGRLSEDENARATWTNQGDSAATIELCDIVFNQSQAWEWPKLCTVFAHELGHLEGEGHSSDPADVMYPYYLGSVLPECAALSPAEGPAPTAPRRGRRSRAKRGSGSKAYRAGTTRHPRRTGSRSRRR